MYKINYLEIEANKEYEIIISRAVEECFKTEQLPGDKLLVSITLTNSKNIHELNKKYRKIDSPTDVLSFPMFEKEEIQEILKNEKLVHEEILGDMVISMEQVKTQAEEYGTGLERELSYMVVHSFCHLLGYDHIKEEDKKEMRDKEEKILKYIKNEDQTV